MATVTLTKVHRRALTAREFLLPSPSVMNINVLKKIPHTHTHTPPSPLPSRRSPSIYSCLFILFLFYFTHDGRRGRRVELTTAGVPPSRAHRYYTAPELYRYKNVMKRPRTDRGRQMARKIKGNGNNGQRTAGQANIFVFLSTIRVSARPFNDQGHTSIISVRDIIV